MFQDRHDAGRQLAELLARQTAPAQEPAPVVFGLARGGVPVAAEVADRLSAPLDVLVARKLGVPWQPELGFGAIAEGGGAVLNQALIADLGLDREAIEDVERRERLELDRRVERYRGGRPPIPVVGRTAILVDDGLATGYTAWAGIKALRAQGAAKVILAAPVAPADTVETLGREADRVVVVDQPDFFMAIGEFYEDFSQTSDDEVLAILEAHRPKA